MNKLTLYFLAIQPNEEVQIKINTFKKEMASHFSSKHALKTPPHVTIIPPFKFNVLNEDIIFDRANDLCHAASPFKMKLQNFGVFSPRVIYVRVLPNVSLNELAENFRHVFKKITSTNNNSQFTPHITIAHRDLTTENFHKAWKHYKELKFNDASEVNEVTVFRHNGKHWEDVHFSSFDATN